MLIQSSAVVSELLDDNREDTLIRFPVDRAASASSCGWMGEAREVEPRETVLLAGRPDAAPTAWKGEEGPGLPSAGGGVTES